jgi:hypothetical protein
MPFTTISSEIFARSLGGGLASVKNYRQSANLLFTVIKSSATGSKDRSLDIRKGMNERFRLIVNATMFIVF